MTEEHLQTSNLRCVSKAIYRKRRKTHPPLPKSRQETHESLAKMNIETNKFEIFLHVNDEETGIIIFTCSTNIACLCSVEQVFMDGNYKCCPKIFYQLYTLHGFQNVHYIPHVYCLLSGKSEEVYTNCIPAIIKLCSDKGHTFEPNVVHIDFEERVMIVMKLVCF